MHAHKTIYYMNMTFNSVLLTLGHINNVINVYSMKKFLKRLFKAYVDGINEMYGPALRAGVNPLF